ncbi:hypothetical protein D5086_007130 [Populus alba]|uniref:Uncharacterized protein n=1 Tax=Populus alba TaxID=43335 RepID=A0ACC4CNP1_POPAL
MGRAPCCSKVGLHRGPWTTREDALLVNYIQKHGEGHWRSLPNKAGNRWSLIAGRLPGRTDNEIKNYWNSHLSKRLQARSNKNGSKCMKESADRKRNVSNLNNKKKQKKDDEGTATRTKIHAPKAIRVSPSSVNIRTHNSTAGSSSLAGGVGDHDDNWFMSDLEVDKNINGDLAWASNRCLDDLVHDDLSGQNYSPSNIDNMLEEMFGEYQQLLNSENHAQLLDSFVDSLLA